MSQIRLIYAEITVSETKDQNRLITGISGEKKKNKVVARAGFETATSRL